MEALREYIDSQLAVQLASSSEVEERATLAGMLISAARRHPAHGISWLGSNGRDILSLSYAELLASARMLLGGLRAHRPQPGARIVLLLERPEDFIPAFWACALGGYLACPIAPVRNDPQRWAQRLSHLNTLLQEPLFVTTGESLKGLTGLDAIDLAQLRTGPAAEPWSGARPADPAVLMLTSGSTGGSKAVVLTHMNLLFAMSAKAQRQELTARDRTLNWISFDHVAALLEGHLLPLFVGASQLHVSAAAILTDPLLFLRLIDRAQVSMTFTPNFLLGHVNAALRTLKAQDTPLALDLSCLRRIICGGEAVVVRTGHELLELLAPCGLSREALWPAFGMTETCAGSIYSREFPQIDHEREVASLGVPIAGLSMRVVDGEGHVLPPGRTGELQLRGPMVFAGYHRNEAATRAAFTPDGWFRTGDLGCIDHGRLRLAGRAKDCIIVNGVNYFSHEIEAAVAGIDGIERGCVAAFAHRPPGADTEQLIIAFAPAEPDPDAATLATLVTAVRNRTVLLWGFRPGVILPLPKEAFPKTSLGKIPRGLLRQRFEAGELVPLLPAQASVSSSERQLPQGDTELAIAALFSGLFGHAIGATDSFFDLGGTSLEILKLKKALEQRFPVTDLPLVTLLQHPTVRALAAWVDAREQGQTYEPLVTLQSTGPRTPLFCVHPGSGEVLVFVHLAARFTGERPFHALRARGLTAGEQPFDTFEEMVSTYTAAIRQQQPHGPYALAGYSFGAPVAFEIARALERAGEKVAFLGSIDGPVFMGSPRAPMDAIECAVILAFFLGLVDRRQLLCLPRQLHSCEDIHSRLLQVASPERLAQLDLTAERFKAWTHLSHGLVQLGESYVPTGRAGRMSVFHAAPLVGSREDWQIQLRGWECFTRSPNRYIEVSGEHHTLLDPGHVASLHAALRDELERALPGS